MGKGRGKRGMRGSGEVNEGKVRDGTMERRRELSQWNGKGREGVKEGYWCCEGRGKGREKKATMKKNNK